MAEQQEKQHHRADIQQRLRTDPVEVIEEIGEAYGGAIGVDTVNISQQPGSGSPGHVDQWVDQNQVDIRIAQVAGTGEEDIVQQTQYGGDQVRGQAAELVRCESPVHREKVRRQQHPKDKHRQQDIDHDDHLETREITRWTNPPVLTKPLKRAEKQQGKQEQGQEIALGGVIHKEGGIELVGENVHHSQQADQGEGQTPQAIIQCDASVVDHGLPLLKGVNLFLIWFGNRRPIPF